MTVRLAAATLVTLAAVTMSGCGSTADAPPQDSFYRLDVPVPAVSRSSSVLDGSLVVKRFTADGTIGQRPLVYAEADSRHALHQYNYHFWADPPPRMAQELTVDVLRAARVADPVVTPDVRISPDYELTGKIKLLEHLRGEQSSVIVGLEFALHRLRDGELMLIESYVVEQPAADASVTEATRAMNQALAEIFSRLVGDLDVL